MIKEFMLRSVLSISLLLAICMSLSLSTVSAQNLDQACQIDPNSSLCLESETSGSRIYGVLRNIANLVSLVAGIAGVVMIMLGGFRYIRSSGDPSKTSEAQNTILFAFIGLAIAAVGQALVLFVFNRLTAP